MAPAQPSEAPTSLTLYRPRHARPPSRWSVAARPPRLVAATSDGGHSNCPNPKRPAAIGSLENEELSTKYTSCQKVSHMYASWAYPSKILVIMFFGSIWKVVNLMPLNDLLRLFVRVCWLASDFCTPAIPATIYKQSYHILVWNSICIHHVYIISKENSLGVLSHNLGSKTSGWFKIQESRFPWGSCHTILVQRPQGDSRFKICVGVLSQNLGSNPQCSWFKILSKSSVRILNLESGPWFKILPKSSVSILNLESWIRLMIQDFAQEFRQHLESWILNQAHDSRFCPGVLSESWILNLESGSYDLRGLKRS